MRSTPRVRCSRIGIVAALVLVVGALSPAFSGAEPAGAATDGQMVYPASGNIQSKVGDGCRGNFRAHDGIDISGQGGTPILAAYDGVIKTRTTNSGYGNYVDIEHPGGYVTRYGHMASPGMQAPGTKVARGQQIGVVGKTGATTAYHLHFEVWRNGSVYSAINGGFTCLANVNRGTTIPLSLPGLAPLPNVSALSADYNGDGKADLLGVAPDSDLQFFAGQGNGRFQSPSVITTAWATRTHLTHADVNNDGRGDVLVARDDGALEIYAGASGGGFGSFTTHTMGWNTMLHLTSGADYTGDGKQDVLAVSPAGVLTIYGGNGAGGFSGKNTAVGGGWQNFRNVIGGDFTNDGRGDLVAVHNDGTLYFYPGTPVGFGLRQNMGWGWGGFTSLSGGVDFTGDGQADLIARGGSGELYLYPGGGQGAFGTRTLLDSGFGGYFQIE